MEVPLIGIVGPCGSGKSTLAANMRALGYRVKHIAQEHSYVPQMWRRLTNPDVLIFLDATYSVTTHRRNLGWTFHEYQEQQTRLSHAREHADLYLVTDELTPEQVRDIVILFMDQHTA